VAVPVLGAIATSTNPVAAIMAIGLLATLRLRETRDHSLIREEHERAC